MENKKQRNTKQRRLILENVSNRYDHPTADDIYTDIHKINPSISKGTVYRNLNLLADNGEILRIVTQGPDRYDSRTNPHYHIVCTRCGKIIDAPLDYLSLYDSELEKKTGFRIERHRAVFLGICDDCASTENS